MILKNKLKISLVLGICILTLSFKIRAQGIQLFEGSWDQLKTEAKKQHKPIFVDCYTSWCGPCKMMATKIFPQKEVGDFYNSNFVCYSVDMEKGEGIQLARKFGMGRG